MKKLNTIKLTNLNRNEIVDREQRLLKGGMNQCGCVAVCTEDICACLDEIGSVPNEAAMYSVTTTKDREGNAIDNIARNTK